MIADKATRALGRLKIISSATWGTSPDIAVLAYRKLIRSILDLGALLIFADAAASNLKILDRVQSAELRTVLGAMKSTPFFLLLLEADETPLSIRRAFLSNSFLVRNLSWSENPLIPNVRLLEFGLYRQTFS